MAVTAATRAACFVHAWRERKWLTQEEYPPAPASLAEMYETHLAIQQHPLVASEFGGHAGYKLGAIGAEGEPCLYAPLFSSYIVAAPGDGLSAAAINLWQLEPEIGFVMGAGLPPRADGTPHTAATVAAAVSKVVLCILTLTLTLTRKPNPNPKPNLTLVVLCIELCGSGWVRTHPPPPHAHPHLTPAPTLTPAPSSPQRTPGGE